MKITNLKCPSCGGKLEPMENNPKIVVCEYCSSQFMLEEDQTINYHIHQYQGAQPQGTIKSSSQSEVSGKTIAAVAAACGVIFMGLVILAGTMDRSGDRETVPAYGKTGTYGVYPADLSGEEEERESETGVMTPSPLYESMVEAMFGKSADQVTAKELESVKYLNLTYGRENCTVEYSFKDPYEDGDFDTVTAELTPGEWEGDNLACFGGLRKLDISNCYDYGDLQSLKQLQGLVCSGLDLAQAAALVSDPGQLKELSAGRLESLEGIGAFENLEILTLEDVVKPDLKQLVSLKHLKALYIEEKNTDSLLDPQQERTLTDYGALSVLTGLERLEVESSYLREFSFLKPLANLTHLALRDTDAISLGPVGELSGLTSLELEDNDSVQDYSAISSLTGLTSLTINKDTSQEDPDLSGLGGLEVLDMSGFMSVSFLGNMGNLKHLSIHGCNVDEANALSGLTGLESLACYSVWTYGVPLTGVNFIDHMPNLKILDFSGISREGIWGGYQRNTEILGDISNVFNHPGLEELYLNNCLFEIRFDRLTENPSLRVLEMREIALKENFYVRTSAGMTDLWYDDVILDGHTDFLTRYPGLEKLCLDGNQLTNVAFASSLKNLTYLSIKNNYVTELSPLNQAENLEFLDIRENPVNSTIETDEKTVILR